MILQGKAVKFLYLSLSLLRVFFNSFFSNFRLSSCEFSFPITQFEKNDGGEGKGQHLQNMWGVGLGSLGNSWEERVAVVGGGAEDAWQSCVVTTQPLEEALLKPSGTLLLVLLEHLSLVGPGLCPLLLLAIVTLHSQWHFSAILPLLHPPPPICICSLLLGNLPHEI